MTASLDHMPFILGAYAVTVISTMVLVGQSWIAMRKAEARRDRAKGK